MENNFTTGVSVAVDYVTDGVRTFVYINWDNPKQLYVRVWINQKHSTENQETIKRRVFYEGNHKTFRESFRLPRVGAGITETISFEVVSYTGEVLFETKPIIYTPKEG